MKTRTIIKSFNHLQNQIEDLENDRWEFNKKISTLTRALKLVILFIFCLFIFLIYHKEAFL